MNTSSQGNEALRERLTRMRMGLARRIPFIGFLVMRLSFRIVNDDRVTGTAGICADGTTYMNEQFCATLSDGQLRGLIMHEVLHVALLWWGRRKEREPRLWNQAHDYAINQIILDLGGPDVSKGWIQLPPGGLHRPEWSSLAAEAIYDLLLSEAADSAAGSYPLEDDCLLTGAATQEGKDAESGTSGAVRRLDQEWRLLVEQAAIHHREVTKASIGASSGLLQKILADIKEARVDWRDVLAQFVGTKSGGRERTLLVPSRRSEAVGVCLAGVRSSHRADVTILWDTSGSMSEEDTTDVLSEVCELMQEYGLALRLLIADSQVRADAIVQDPADIVPLLTGGGGSDFRPAFSLLEAEQDSSVVVAFTDGMISVPEVMPQGLTDVLWIIARTGERPAAWGRAIKMVDNNEAKEV